MNKKIKTLIYITGGIILLALVVLISRYAIYKPVIREIPVLSNTANLSVPVKEQLAEALQKARFRPSSENLGLLGMAYHSSANYNEASKCYQLAIKRNKKDWVWNYYEGYLNMEMGNSEAVIDNFTQVTEKNQDIDLAWYYLGQEYKNQRNYDMAEKLLTKISDKENRTAPVNENTRTDHFPIGTYATFELARIYFETGRNDLAEKTLIELSQNSSLFGASYKLLGTIYNLKGDTISGKKYTTRANDLVNFSPPVDTLMDKLVLMSRSELYLLKKIDEAEKSFHSDWALKLVKQGMQYMPDNSYLVSKAIKIYLWKNLKEEAIALTDKHLALIAGNYTEIKNTGITFFQREMYEQAAKYWKVALELKSDDVLIQEYLAKSLYVTGEKQKSFEILEEVIGKNPDDKDVLANAAELMVQFGLKEKANDLLIKLKKMDPANPNLMRISANIAMLNKNKEKAIPLYESAFKGDPEDVKTVRNLGELYKYDQMWKKYIDLYKTALQYNPNNPDFLARLGEVLISCPDTSLRNIELGKEYSERAFTYYNCPPDILIASGSHLAYAYAMLGDKQKAITTISQTINIGRRQNIPADQQLKLENLHKAFQNLAGE